MHVEEIFGNACNLKKKKKHTNILLWKRQDEEHCQILFCQEMIYIRCKESKERLW